jgi:pimeloyl-ACP methyl ester carboxylesterase
MVEASHVRLPDGRQLGYQEYGDPHGHSVFFFHGWIGSRLDFAPNDAIARGLGIRVVSVDRPACGSRTPWASRVSDCAVTPSAAPTSRHAPIGSHPE